MSLVVYKAGHTKVLIASLLLSFTARLMKWPLDVSGGVPVPGGVHKRSNSSLFLSFTAWFMKWPPDVSSGVPGRELESSPQISSFHLFTTGC